MRGNRLAYDELVSRGVYRRIELGESFLEPFRQTGRGVIQDEVNVFMERHAVRLITGEDNDVVPVRTALEETLDRL